MKRQNFILIIQCCITTIAVVVFYFGITLPIVEVTTLLFLTQTPSLIDIIQALYLDGEWVLAMIIGSVSILFPAIKLLALTLSLIRPLASTGFIHVLHAAGRWAMLDVVVVALSIFAAKTSGLANAASQPGLWCFALAALLSQIAVWMANKRRAGRRR